MDTRNGEYWYPVSCSTECKVFNWVCDWNVTSMSSFYADCHFFGKDTHFHRNYFKGLTLRFDSYHGTFNDSCAGRCSLSKLHSLKRLSFHGWCARVWLLVACSNVREIMCYCQRRFNCGRTKTSKELQAIGWCLIHSRCLAPRLCRSISCYVMPIRVILHVMDAFGAGCYSRIQANVAWLTLLILLLV